jgi:hypothetical protein
VGGLYRVREEFDPCGQLFVVKAGNGFVRANALAKAAIGTALGRMQKIALIVLFIQVNC